MSRYPALSSSGQAVPASIFAKLREHLARYPGDVIPLQIGDTYLPPPVALGGVVERASAADVYAYGAAQGAPALIDAVVEKVRRENGVRGVGGGNVQITAGATQALAAAVAALCDPGDELIIVSPHWPLIRGQAIAHHVVPVEVDGVGGIEAAITARTSAVYFGTPNNPDGAVMSAADVERVAAIAEAHGLWVLADEVYEHYVYEGAHASIAARIPERCVTVFSFSKSYAQAGLRIGYAVAPEPVAFAMRKIVNHAVYNVPAVLQHAAHAALAGGEGWLADARATYRVARDRAAVRLAAPAAIPAGGAYLWVDFRAWGADCMPVLEACAANGVLLAPGHAFGAAYTGFARLCFTGVPLERLEAGIDRVNAVVNAMTTR